MSVKSVIFVSIVGIVMTCLSSLYGSDGLTFGGEGKLRLRYVQTDSSEITGSYGEILKKGISFRQRIDLFMSYPIVDYLVLEAGVRISNENVNDILPPPDFISTDLLAGWWSVKLDRGPFLANFGSYETSFTPLTLMRWDTNDNPLAASGCACQISVGGIGGESLEEPQENYRLEGLKIEAGGDIGDVKAIFARTQLALEGGHYAQYTYGTRGRLVLNLPLFSPVSLGGTVLRAQDDLESVDISIIDPLQSDVGSIDLRVPCFGGCAAVGECALSRRDDNLLNSADAVRQGYGIISGLQFKRGDQIDAQALYLQMDPYFSPLYRAVSYAKNRQGARISLTHRTIGLFGKKCAASIYVKRLKEIKPTWHETITEWHRSLSDFLVANGSINVSLSENFKTEFCYEYRQTGRVDDIATTLNDEKLEIRTQIGSIAVIYEFTMQSKLILKYQYARNDDGAGGTDYIAHTPSLLVTLRF
ncbi:MAG TPA: hypothetical protein VF399_02075 [bacterium]